MSFTYTPEQLDTISLVRLLIPDTDSANPIFSDAEINAFIYINSQVWQTPMLFTPPIGTQTLPLPPQNYYRIAALAIDSIASSKARLSAITQLLDVKLSPDKAAKALRDQAQAYRDIDDNSGAFAIIEQVNGDFSYRDRWWKQVQREVAP